MQFRSVVSAGCSFSDYLQNNLTVYGQELANLLGCKYQHQGAGAGSNWRIWRQIGGMVQRGEITDQDLVTIQYTGLERREFWSRFPGNPWHDPGPLKIDTREPCHGGYLIRYKAWAWQWQDNSKENKFFKLYENNHVCTEYEQEWFDLQHYQFQLLLREHGIRCVFIEGRHIPNNILNLISPFDQWRLHQGLEFQTDESTWNLPTDNSHLSDHGHRVFAGMLYDHVRNKFA